MDSSKIDWKMTGQQIEKDSLRIISEEYCGPDFSDENWPIARRLIHTTADFTIANNLFISKNAVVEGRTAIVDGAKMYCDSKMIRSGLSRYKLSLVNEVYNNDNMIISPVSDPEVKYLSEKEQITRALAGVKLNKDVIDGGIVLIGNSPVALAAIAELIDKGEIMPRLVIGMPVGFVHVVESKDMILECNVPQIVITGRRGGSPLAVATLHAILEELINGKIR